MMKSARLVGREMGKTALEMNALLWEHGYLEGSPGAYFLTEKGKEYGSEEDHHRGNPGSIAYSAAWTTRTWAEGIVDALDADMAADHPETEASTEPASEGEQEVEPERPAWVPIALFGGAVVTLFGGVMVATNPRVHRWVGENVTPRARKVWRTMNKRGPVGAAADHDDDDDAPSEVVGLAEATAKDEAPE